MGGSYALLNSSKWHTINVRDFSDSSLVIIEPSPKAHFPHRFETVDVRK
jgi:hypothetical protein